MALVGRYHLMRLLGSGGAGQVFLASDRARGGLQVALKRIRAEVDDLLKAAFEREFSIMASLSVPGIAQVFDFGVAPANDDGFSGGPFFTRAYVEGQSLGEAAQALSLEERLSLFLRVCDVIAPLHRVGVTHGDIKPGNVIVTAARDVSVIDFGLSRMLDRSRTVEPSGGTPAYMAPELLQGAPSSVGADIYALGSLLWQLMSGRMPFADLGSLSVSAKVSGQAPNLPPDGSKWLNQVLHIAERALRYDPLDRFPTVAELQQALSELLPERQVSSPAYVPPRPRGHEGVLQQLERALTAPKKSDGQRLWLLQGAQGSGRTLLLRELRWRLQLRGFQVLDLAVPMGSGRASPSWFLEQVRLLLGEDSPAATQGDAPLSSWIAGELAELLARAAGTGPVVLMVDDLDLAERALGEVLRSALFDERAEGVMLLTTASEAQSSAVSALGPEGRVAVTPLPAEAVADLATEALGPLDASVTTALAEVSQGMPAALMDALLALSTVRAPTARDVHMLQPGAAAAALAQARLGRVPASALDLIWLLAVVDRVPIALAERLLASAEGGVEVRQLELLGVATRRGNDIWLADAALGKMLRKDGTGRPPGADRPAVEAASARRMLSMVSEADLPIVARARLAVLAQDADMLLRVGPKAVEVLHAEEAHVAAIALNEAMLPLLPAPQADAARLQIASDRQSLGEHAEAAELAMGLVRTGGLKAAQKSEAAVVAARALTALARYDDAVVILGEVSVEGNEHAAEQRARVLRELSRVHMRRGDYDAVVVAADAGLSLLPADDPLRIELLCSKGVVAGYRGEPDAAEEHYNAAQALAERTGSHRDLAKVFAYRAIRCARAGDLEGARPLFEEALRCARQVGDIALMANASLNLGGILFYLGDAAGAESHYQTASRMARRAGSIGTDIQARNNLAHLHVYLGLYERARGELESVLAEAKARGHRYIQAQAQAVYGDLYARCGDLDRSLIAYDDAIARYRELGQMREVAEHHLDAAEALLDRSGPADVSAVAERLSAAREIVLSEKLDDLNVRRELLTARARLASGEAEAVLSPLEELSRHAETEKKRDLQWSALAASARAHLALGAEFAASSHFRRAVEILEEQAVRLPREYRDAFWHDPRRRAVRAELSALADSSHRHLRERVELSTALADPRMSRLLEIIKRLAVEHDLTRLLERIVDSAVELSGAERGLVLLTDERGHLAPHLARGQAGVLDEAAVAFSRSIAEAVLIDGDSIVSMDASVDGRLNEYASVHNLSLRSVACLPIRSVDQAVGVLYLEHRRSRTCFTEPVVDLLHAFADQAAIALVNARLLRENQERQQALETANAELAGAKRQLEDALSARSEELSEVREELARLTGARQRHLHFGMVGNSPAMMRVFGAIERLKDAAVPVVIRGESGTGKELVARAMHYAGIRRQAPFVPVNCGALPDSLLESELFGYVRGAFSGADRDRTGLISKAHGGTLFLDEVADMPAKMQVDLLRVLQEGTVCKLGSDAEERVSVRFVAATQRDLRELVAEGKFREDLYYRLNVVEVVLPPLRERQDDIPELCTHLLKNFSKRDGLPERRLNAAALRALMATELPGNVRQLEHMLLQATLMSSSNSIGPADLNLDPVTVESSPTSESAPPETTEDDAPLAENVEEFRELEKRRILQALEVCGWNRARAAQTLGMARRTFYRRLQEYQIL